MARLIGPISWGQDHLRQNSALLHSRCCLSITMGAGANTCERQNSRNRIRCDLENIGNAFCKGSFKKDINIPIYPALHLNSSSTQIQSTKQITKLRFHKQQLFPTLFNQPVYLLFKQHPRCVSLLSLLSTSSSPALPSVLLSTLSSVCHPAPYTHGITLLI